MSISRHFTWLILLGILSISCNDLSESLALLDEETAAVSLVDYQNASSIRLLNWQQVTCDSIGAGCVYSSRPHTTDSIRITASVTFRLKDSIENKDYSMELNFSKIFGNNDFSLQSQDTSSFPATSPLLASPDAWWNDFFLGSQWVGQWGRSAWVVFSVDSMVSLGQFGPGVRTGIIWVTQLRRFTDENGKQWATMDGEFHVALIQETGASEPTSGLDEGRFSAKFPLE